MDVTSPLARRSWDRSEVTELLQVLHNTEYPLLELRGVAAGSPAIRHVLVRPDEVVDPGTACDLSPILRGGEHYLWRNGEGRQVSSVAFSQREAQTHRICIISTCNCTMVESSEASGRFVIYLRWRIDTCYGG